MLANLLNVDDQIADDGAKTGGSLNCAAIGNKTH